jgi:hypothetical protein
MVQMTDIVILEMDMHTFSGESNFLSIYSKYIMDVSLATETTVHFCIFIENKIDTEPIKQFIETNNFQNAVQGLELIVGTTEWEEVEGEE